MNKDSKFSEEQLNAFVDDELDPEEKSRLYNEAELFAELDRQLCRQRKIKELVQHAYGEVPPPARPARSPLPRAERFGRLFAAVLLLAVGISAGLVAHGYLDRERGTAAGRVADENFLLHVTSGDPIDMRATLRQARSLLDNGTPGQPVRVEVVANERGLDLLRSDVTPFASEISALSRNDVVFYACSRTIERLEEEGVAVNLVPEARFDSTALDRVVIRMQEGWEYIKI